MKPNGPRGSPGCKKKRIITYVAITDPNMLYWFMGVFCSINNTILTSLSRMMNDLYQPDEYNELTEKNSISTLLPK